LARSTRWPRQSCLPRITSAASPLRMTFDKGEEGTHKLKINIVDEDGKPVMPSIEIGVEIAVPDETMFLSRNLS
jgi:hypothetical protein